MQELKNNQDGTYNYIIINGDEKGKVIQNNILFSNNELVRWNDNMNSGLYTNGNIRQINNLDYIEIEEK